MTSAPEPTNAISHLIDELERIREELFVLQRSLEKHEAQESTEPKPVKARTTGRAISA
jgi:hypothetical protein